VDGICQCYITTHGVDGICQRYITTNGVDGICQCYITTHVVDGICQCYITAHGVDGTCQCYIKTHGVDGTWQCYITTHGVYGTCQCYIQYMFYFVNVFILLSVLLLQNTRIFPESAANFNVAYSQVFGVTTICNLISSVLRRNLSPFWFFEQHFLSDDG
jgi:hypothetical protein